MKLSQLKEEIKGIIRERGVAAIQKEYQKTIEEIEKALISNNFRLLGFP